ncbi:MAG TPA: glycosyltransferase family 1 protein [Stellaceae bacterium]|nr:glycosyltransferase family 1 protein [Stellaceae bacterium]
MKIALVTDAWAPQVNGVVRTLSELADGLTAAGHEVLTVTPNLFRTVPCPTDPAIRLAVVTRGILARLLDAFAPDTIHIATEGPLGLAGRAYCVRQQRGFTTSFHTKFPEYLNARLGLPVALGYAALRWFHGRSNAVMVATETVRRELLRRAFPRVVPWTRGVDANLFRPGAIPAVALPRPVFLYVGRISPEKNLPDFLDLDLPGSKLVVGDGPLLSSLRRRYPQICFAGRQDGTALVRHYASADVFVLPSRTETFGLVLLEALACGLPVAALPVPGPLDVIGKDGPGVLDRDLRRAALGALAIPREACRDHALRFSWRACIDQFLTNVAASTRQPVADFAHPTPAKV